MKNKEPNQHESDHPAQLAMPARRALAEAGYTQLAQLAEVSETDLSRLHGIGPNAIRRLRETLDGKGLSFAERANKED